VGGASCSPVAWVAWKGQQNAAPTFGTIRNNESSAYGNVANRQTFVIARAKGPWQSISTIRRERAHIHPLAPLGGRGWPEGPGEGAVPCGA
jgi:hypothetical protein